MDQTTQPEISQQEVESSTDTNTTPSSINDATTKQKNLRKLNINTIIKEMFEACEIKDLEEPITTDFIRTKISTIYEDINIMDITYILEEMGFKTASYLGDATWLLKPKF